MTEPLSPQREAEQPICSPEAARAAGLDVAPAVTDLAACAESIVQAWGDRSAEPGDEVASVADAGAQLARALPLLLAERAKWIGRLDATARLAGRLENENARLRRELNAPKAGDR